MTVEKFLKNGDKRKRIYKDVKDYIEIIEHHYGVDRARQEQKKQVVEIIGIEV